MNTARSELFGATAQTVSGQESAVVVQVDFRSPVAVRNQGGASGGGGPWRLDATGTAACDSCGREGVGSKGFAFAAQPADRGDLARRDSRAGGEGASHTRRRDQRGVHCNHRRLRHGVDIGKESIVLPRTKSCLRVHTPWTEASVPSSRTSATAVVLPRGPPRSMPTNMWWSRFTQKPVTSFVPYGAQGVVSLMASWACLQRIDATSLHVRRFTHPSRGGEIGRLGGLKSPFP